MSSQPYKAASMKIVGYSDRYSVQPGQKIRFMVSTKKGEMYQAELVRLIHGDTNPNGPGFKEEKIQNVGRFSGREQPLYKGSYVRVPLKPILRRAESFTLQAWIFPTLLDDGIHGIITRWSDAGGAGYGLFMDAKRLSFWSRSREGKTAKVSLEKEIKPFSWYFVSASYDPRTGRISVRQQLAAHNEQHETDDSSDMVVENIGKVGDGVSDLMIAAYQGGNPREKRDVNGQFNGKIDGPKLFGRVLADSELERLASGKAVSRGLIASWDFATNTQSTQIRDKSPNRLHGESVNFPVRAVTGHNWSGRELDFKRAPEEYDAIHFHEDSLGDAGWKTDFTFTVPAKMRSGVYAAKLTTTDGAEDYVPFFVRPRKGTATSKIVFVVPTLSYLAYGDEHTLTKAETRIAMNITEMDYPKQPQDVYVNEHGLHSLYDYYLDGAGVPYTSRLRPLVNMRPKYVMQSLNSAKGAPHQFNADLHLTDWLEEEGFEFDVITDEDLHHEGVSVLKPYRVVLTGSHHEYWTTPMLDALEAYLNEGGRMMYLGGNGFYWVTTVNPEKPWIFEVRRWGGTGSWMADPGEYHNSFTGEPGGVWRNRGRHPQKLVGVGFSAQGFDMNRPYKRQPGSFDKSVAFMFEGIGKNEPIGDFPSLVLNEGAAGFELDRVDYRLGSPSHTLILGTATGFSDNYQHVIEEVNLMDNKQGGTTHPLVKADLAYLRYPKGGGVFSTGSISWCGSLSYNNYDNNVSRLMTNVLKRFSSDEPLP